MNQPQSIHRRLSLGEMWGNLTTFGGEHPPIHKLRLIHVGSILCFKHMVNMVSALVSLKPRNKCDPQDKHTPCFGPSSLGSWRSTVGLLSRDHAHQG